MTPATTRQKTSMSSSTAARPGLAIRWRLTISIAVVFALALIAVFFSMRFAVNQILQDDINDDLNRTYGVMSGRMVSAVGGDLLADEVNDFTLPIVIVDQEGNPGPYNTFADPLPMRLSDEEFERVLAEGGEVTHTVEMNGQKYRVRSGRVSLENGVPYVLQVGRSTQAAEDVLATITYILLGGGALALVVLLGAGYWIARSTLRPVEQVTQLAAEIEASDLTRRLAVEHAPAEVQRLANTFDAMLARLEAAFGQQRNFVMDVSHELRTPLTALRGNIDVTLMSPDMDPETRAQLERMSAEVERLIRLTSNLLYFAHAEAGREIVRRPVDLDGLCLEVVHQARDIRSDVNVRVAHEEQLSVAGDRDLLKQLILNLVDNAIKFSPPGGEVVVTLQATADSAEVTVEDTGPGIPPEQTDLIFERFYRGSNSRSRTVGGAGIGLAISRWIARAHGGDVRVQSEVGKGSRFIVTLPLAASLVTA